MAEKQKNSDLSEEKNLDSIRVKKSKFERVLGMSSDEIIARAIQDMLKREEENETFRKNRKK